jgi:NAD(P)-dependent dehydrogenase (short-subunit alcohol dehydrogenase family)/rhamnose utilization protein RhaD (predicted bifunctional aldolase and dehydrogenase)
MTLKLEDFAALSRRFGADAQYVLLGGGNTSMKTAETLTIKPSGVALGGITPEQFINLDRAVLRNLFTAEMPTDGSRENAVKDLVAAAVRPLGTGRPSVEAPLHEVMDFTYVFHMHPALVNGLTCGAQGADACARLFPDALWIEYTDPGYTLAMTVYERLQAVTAAGKAQPNILFLQNHGIFVGANSLDEIESIYANVMSTLTDAYAKAGVKTVLQESARDDDAAFATAPVLRTLLGTETSRAVVASGNAFDVPRGPLTPDHIVYAKSFALAGAVSEATVDAFKAQNGYLPKIVSLPGQAVLAAAPGLKAAKGTLEVARDGALVQQLTAAFGGPRYLTDREREFIENWEVESYRQKVAAGGAANQRMQNKICLVTGAAQGFGLGIAQGLASEGAIVVVADMNADGAKQAADDIEKQYGTTTLSIAVNVTDEASVENMMRELVLSAGGVDLLVNNAGVLRAGSVKELSLKDWDFVTAVNYTGYFLCAKHTARIMSAQFIAGRSPWSDIVQINSKSGLEGSNKNGAYAGSKFGTIGLTQSFAMELVTEQIKVNSICPGNFFDGPLWSDPDRGLFVQYLNTGKVPGAKTVADVKRFYEAKVPMARGCRPEDVLKAILYTVEQQYETGQAIPVTGGQVMLN